VAWTIFHISVLREYLHADLQVPGKFEDMERLVDDFVFLTFLLGNDFIPHLPALDIGEGCFDLLFKEYRKALLIMGDYLTKDGEITSAANFETFLGLISAHEDEIFTNRQADEQKVRAALIFLTGVVLAVLIFLTELGLNLLIFLTAIILNVLIFFTELVLIVLIFIY
jgi:5'-3' exonuclease